MSQIKEPLLACPNDPDDVKPLSEVAGDKIDEVFIGSCMTNIGHFRAAGKLLQAAGRDDPDAPVDRAADQDGRAPADGGRLLQHLAKAGARTEMPGCSLCMGNQARVAANSTACRPPRATSPTAWGRAPTCSFARPSWRPSPRCWASCRRSRSTWNTRQDRHHGAGDLPLSELRHHARLRRGSRTRPDRGGAVRGVGRPVLCRASALAALPTVGCCWVTRSLTQPTWVRRRLQILDRRSG
jgi:hypothetical protein